MFKCVAMINTANPQVNNTSIKPGDLLYVCDYQMNGTVLHVDSTTTSKMGANTCQFCIYPVFVMVGLVDGAVVRGGVIFLSRDLKHDWRQVDKTFVLLITTIVIMIILG